MSEIKGSARRQGVTVEVFPGGALAELSLTAPALGLGAESLSAAILDAVAEATALANQRTRHALRDALTGLTEHDLEVLGLGQDPTLTERVEATTPDTWRA